VLATCRQLNGRQRAASYVATRPPAPRPARRPVAVFGGCGGGGRNAAGGRPLIDFLPSRGTGQGHAEPVSRARR
ncbi:unnamed protein product, partial [Amoebophrya sp. A120]